MITLVTVKNPFSPRDGREVKQIEYTGSLADLLKENEMPNVDLRATVNGYSVADDYVIKDKDFVVLYPAIEKGGGKGKSILGIIAAVVLSVVAMGVGGMAATGVWGSFAGASAMAATGGYLIAAAIMFLGSVLIGRMTGQKIDTGNAGYGSEATYSWGGVKTLEGQNNPVALTYGIVKSGGQTIGKYTMASGSDEYLYWLVSAGEGEVEITDIKLNDNSIELYQDVSYEIRNGTNDQKIINYFGDTHFTLPLSYNMETLNTWYSSEAQGNATQGLIIKIECPNGLLHTTDKGSIVQNYVAVQIEVKEDDGAWVGYASFDTADLTDYDSTRNALIIRGKSTKAIRKEYRIDRLPTAQWTVRVRVTERGYSNVQRDSFATYWTGLGSIIYDDFTYPCTALLGIKAKATGQLSGSPTLSFLKARGVVYVWNPHANEYQTKVASNPAWACYDLLHQCRPLKNIHNGNYEYEVRGVPANLMRYDDFANWAEYCEEKNYYVNIEIVSAGEMIDVANERIAPIGHGMVVRFGTKYGCIFARPQQAVQMFGMGNIIEGSFHEEFLKLSDRANCVEVTFTNEAADYERDVITVYSDTYDTDAYQKSAQVTMDGCTKFSQAYREGVYQLLCNKLQLRTVSFEAGIDSIACTVGDVVIISHDVPKWQNSGRVETVTGNTILLPCEVADDSAVYLLQWRESANDTLHEQECSVVEIEDGWTTVELDAEETITTIHAGDIFSIAETGTEDKLFTVQSITRSQDFTRTISCIEYNEGVFEEPTNYDGDDEHENIFVVAIQQNQNEGITVRKYKGQQSITYTTSFTEYETGWRIEVSIDSPSGYAPGELLVNGVAYNTGSDFPLNRDYTITATAAAVGQTVYINGTTDHPYGYSGVGNRWFVMYSDPACRQSVNQNTLVGRLRCIDVNGHLQYGDSIFGIPKDWTNVAGWCQYVTEIAQNIDASAITQFQYCFNRCYQLQSVNLTHWDTGNATSFFAMFKGCNNLLHTGDISHWDTAYITDCSEMFIDNHTIQSIDLSGWNTPSLVYCNKMFQQCYALKVLDISGWNTTNIVNANDMFYRDSNLEYIIMDSYEVMFGGNVSMPSPNEICKYLVPASMVASYQNHANWEDRAGRIDSIANYTIIHSNGHVTVIPLRG